MKVILVLASNPKDTSSLDLDREIREIREGLRQSPHRDQFAIDWRGAVRPVDLRRALLEVEPQIVHFCGHGNGDDGLVLEDDLGQSQMVSSDALSNLFSVFSQQVDCIILNSCYSEVQADALIQHINYVIGMSQEMPDEAAIAFSLGFYEALGAGRSIEDAYRLGCTAIQMELESNRFGASRKFTPIQPPGDAPRQPLLPHLIPVLKQRSQLIPIQPKAVQVERSQSSQHQSLIGHSDWVRSIAISPDGKMLLSSSNDKTVRLWDTQTGELLHLLTGHRERIKCVGIYPDGKTLLSCSADSQVKGWNVAQLRSKKTGDCQFTIKASSKVITLVNTLPVNPDAERGYFITGGEHGKVSFWNCSTGDWIRTFQAHSSPVLAAAFSPDGKRLVTGSQNGWVKVWDLDGPLERPIYEPLHAHLSEVLCLAISPDGETLVSGGADRTIKLWDLKTGHTKQPHMLEGHAGRVWSVAISPDSQTLATASGDFTVKLWHLPTGQLINTLTGHLGEVRCIAFSPDGHFLASGGDDLEIRLWAV